MRLISYQYQAKHWASQHNTKVIRWFRIRKRLDNFWKGKPKKLELENAVLKAMEEDCFYELFVAGAAGYSSENINTNQNGVKIKYHSLSFGTSEEDEVFNEE